MRRPAVVTGRLVFDGECGFCTRCVGWVRRLDRQGRIDIRPLQAEGAPASVGATTEQCREAVRWLGPDGASRSGAAAVNAVVSALSGTELPSTVYRASSGLQERAYRWVADHRGRFPGTTPYCQDHPADCAAAS